MVNVGTISRRCGEVIEMAAWHRLDFCCLQEMRWRGGSARTMGCAGGRYKFRWAGCAEGVAGVGFLVAEKWIDNVIGTKRVSERMMVLRLRFVKAVLNIISVFMRHKLGD